jgi:hypothetical protein
MVDLVYREGLDRKDDVRLLEYGLRGIRPSHVLVSRIRELGADARAMLDNHPGTGLDEFPGDLRDETYARF